MNDQNTIHDVAWKVLKIIGRAAAIEEIYAEIIDRNLYRFDTPTPEHVLRTSIRRHTRGVERIDASDVILFELVGDEKYMIASDSVTETKKQVASGMKRIQRASDKEEIIKALMAEQVGVFKEIWRLLIFTAQVGFKNERREPLKAVDAGKGIDQSTFGNCPAWPGVLYLMSLADSGKSDCLSGTTEAEEERIASFQEYANGGLTVLKEFFSDRPLDLDGLIAFIDTQREEAAGRPDLELLI
jgi:dnd system-associated protein 4